MSFHSQDNGIAECDSRLTEALDVLRLAMRANIRDERVDQCILSCFQENRVSLLVHSSVGFKEELLGSGSFHTVVPWRLATRFMIAGLRHLIALLSVVR